MDTKGHERDWVQPRPPAYAEATAGKPAADHAAGATAEGVLKGSAFLNADVTDGADEEAS